MAKVYQRKRKATSKLPKGIVGKSSNTNPFENARASSAKKQKFQVHNRNTSGSNPHKGGAAFALARSVENRRNGLQLALKQAKKAGTFIDRRIGESDGAGYSGGSKKPEMSEDERMLARVVRERARRSKKSSKYTLDEDRNDNPLTHSGRVIDESYTGKLDADNVILSDDEDDRRGGKKGGRGGELDETDVDMHFGGGVFDSAKRKKLKSNPYGPSAGKQDESEVIQKSLGEVYGRNSRKDDLDDLIRRKKIEKAERAKAKEDQVETFEGMDDQFKELASMLNFRDKSKERKENFEARRKGTLTEEDKDMDDWNKEMKGYLFDRKVKATDRTKTQEEIAKEEAERLQELETKRLARMNGDFEDDDLSDVQSDDGKSNTRSKTRQSTGGPSRNPDELDSDVEEDDKPEVRFTPDGLVYVDKEGNILKKVENEVNGKSSKPVNDEMKSLEEDGSGDEESSSSEDASEKDSDENEEVGMLGESDDEASNTDSSDSESDSDNSPRQSLLEVGTRVKGKYRAGDQFEGGGKWYKAKITSVTNDVKTGNVLYDVEYDDGDFEEGLKAENVKRLKIVSLKRIKEREKKAAFEKLQEKKQKAKKKARTEIPYVFEVPTTLELLHDMIGRYAATGADACLIVQRIHAANSVRLNKKNKEKMQNFYDVLLRRFVGVGDALYKSGDGGDELTRYKQLDSLTQILYQMAQDSPTCAASVWCRRLGIFQKALSKQIRDSEFISIDNNDNFTAWPSTGTLLLFRALSHIFPVTDSRHPVVTPALILLGQTIAQTPVRSMVDVVRGIFCAGLMIEYTKETKRLPSEALAFLAGVLRLFADNASQAIIKCPIPSLASSMKFSELKGLRSKIINGIETEENSSLSLEEERIRSDSTPKAVLIATLRLMDKSIGYYSGGLKSAEVEVFDQIMQAVLSLNPKCTNSTLPDSVVKIIAKLVDTITRMCRIGEPRLPLLRRSAVKPSDLAVLSIAPRMEDPTRYMMSKDKGKTRLQGDRDRLRREYKREHKAVARELRLDGAFIENERRKEKNIRDSKAKEKRQQNFSWLEKEQATMNQQVAQGGGLLTGGGTGVARAKAASGKIGMKRGGKF